MAEISQDLKECHLHDVVEGLFREQKRDIYLYTRGHLNPDHLWKPAANTSHTAWESSGKAVPLLLERSKIPTPRRSVRGEEQVIDALCNFSVGTSGSVYVHPKQKPGQTAHSSTRSWRSLQQSPIGESRERGSDPDLHAQRPNTQQGYIADNVYVEELRLPELMLPVASKKSPRRNSPKEGKRRGSGGVLETHQFIPSHLAGITKKDQYQQFKHFQDEVLRIGDIVEKNVLSGRKAVEHLEEKLYADLMKLETSKRQGGPNFHKLQIYSNIWKDLNEETPTLGKLLSEIKSHYDQYLGVLLDTQPHKHSELLSRQVQSLTNSGLVLHGELSLGQDYVKILEDEATACLLENDRLRQKVREEKEQLSQLPPDEEIPQASINLPRKEGNVQSLTDQVLELHADILSKIEEINQLKQNLKAQYVPSSVCHHLEQNLRDTEADILKLLSTNEYLEKTIQNAENEIDKIFEKSDVSELDIRQIWKSINSLSSGLPGPED